MIQVRVRTGKDLVQVGVCSGSGTGKNLYMICTCKDLVQLRICSGSGTGKSLYRICT